MTRLEIETIKAIKQWCVDNGMETKGRLRHIFPRAYVIGRPAFGCLFVATPPVDAEPQVKDIRFNGEDGSVSVHLFDKTLKAGDWKVRRSPPAVRHLVKSQAAPTKAIQGNCV